MEVYGFCDRICRTKKGNNFFLLAGDVTLERILPSPAYTHQRADRPTDAFLRTWGHNHLVHKGSASSRASSFKWVEADWAVGARPGPCAAFGKCCQRAQNRRPLAGTRAVGHCLLQPHVARRDVAQLD